MPRHSVLHARARPAYTHCPEVRAVASRSDLPWTGYDENTGFDIVGRKFPDGEGPGARYHFVTPGYTAATGTPLVAGTGPLGIGCQGAPLVVLDQRDHGAQGTGRPPLTPSVHA